MKSMFIAMVLVFSGLFSSMTLAQDLNFQEYRKFLMNGNQGTGSKMAIQTTCTTTAGQTYRVGEKDYDTCLIATKDRMNQKQLTGGKDSTSLGAAAGTSTTIHFGK
jgi:hypothetical protein